VVTAIAIALHNIPEGMAVSTAVLAAGGSRRRAFAYTAVSMLGEMLGAALLLVLDLGLSPAAATQLLAAVAGVMVALSLTQLVPAGIGLVRGTTAIDSGDAVPVGTS
jgi:ZIP family zinc transporter